MEQTYELWRWEGPEGKYSYQLLPAGHVPPEFQKFGTQVPMDPDLEKELLSARLSALKKLEGRRKASR